MTYNRFYMHGFRATRSYHFAFAERNKECTMIDLYLVLSSLQWKPTPFNIVLFKVFTSSGNWCYNKLHRVDIVFPCLVFILSSFHCPKRRHCKVLIVYRHRNVGWHRVDFVSISCTSYPTYISYIVSFAMLDDIELTI